MAAGMGVQVRNPDTELLNAFVFLLRRDPEPLWRGRSRIQTRGVLGRTTRTSRAVNEASGWVWYVLKHT